MRLLLAWTTVSVVVSPLIGACLAAATTDTVRVPATSARP